MSDVEGAGSKASALYPYVADIDDGTWWELIQSGASGVGMAVWDTTHVTLQDVNDYTHGFRPSSFDPVFTPAFVRWQADPYSIQAGLMVRITEFRCFDNTIGEIHNFEHRSMYVNLIDGDGIGPREASFPGYYLPVWSVVPIDSRFCSSWIEDAVDHWDAITQAQRYYQDGYSFVLDEFEEHYTAWDYDDNGNRTPVSCDAYLLMHTCGREYGQPACSECIDCEIEDIDWSRCTCGLSNYLQSLRYLMESADPSPSISHHRDVFFDTWKYALDAHTQGWQRCFDLAHSERKPFWFTSFWRQCSPYSVRPGHGALARRPSTTLTDSSTPLAS